MDHGRITFGMTRSVPIRGQLLRRSEHRAVALYLRDGRAWIADFVDEDGIVVDVDTWVRFNCGSVANAQAARRATRESAIPLSADLAARIESLHDCAPAPRRRGLRRWLAALVATLPRGRLAMQVALRWPPRRATAGDSAS